MQNATTFLAPLNAQIGSDFVFNVVIAYEDFETGKLAKKTYDYLVEHLGQECELCHQMWKFEVLALPRLREYAVQDATVGDIVLVATHGRELPPQVTDWLDAWAAHAPRTLALVLLSDAAPDETREAHTYLAGVAAKAGVEFFAQPGAWPGRVDHPAEASRDRGYDPTYNTLSNVLTRDVGVTPWKR